MLLSNRATACHEGHVTFKVAHVYNGSECCLVLGAACVTPVEHITRILPFFNLGFTVFLTSDGFVA